MIQIELMDYSYEKTLSLLFDLDTVEEMTITVLSGDEILDVLYKNGESDQWDASNCRDISYFDGTYIIYSVRRGINRLEEFSQRVSSYSMFREIDE